MSSILSHAPSYVVSKWLIGIGATNLNNAKPWPTFVSLEPATPDNCVTVYDTSTVTIGTPDMVQGRRSELYGIQVRLRSTLFELGAPRIYAIGVAMDRMYQYAVTVGSVNYLINSIQRLNTIRLGAEPTSKRQLWVINARVELVVCCPE